MTDSHMIVQTEDNQLALNIDNAIAAIPPAWPLASNVAVNPFFGQASQNLTTSSALMAQVAGIALTMPRVYYAEQIKLDQINDHDIEAAIKASQKTGFKLDIAAVKSALDQPSESPQPFLTIADLAQNISGRAWPDIVTDRISVWAGGYFDQGQALWAAHQDKSAYAAWRARSSRDLTPEIHGLRSFCAFVETTRQNASDAIAEAVEELGLMPNEVPNYLHSLLVSLGGWAHVGRYKLWQADLAKGSDETLLDLLAIRLVYEQALHAQYQNRIAEEWRTARAAFAKPVAPSRDQVIDSILQDAAERGAQRRLAAKLNGNAKKSSLRPSVQAAFCIDVRSEIFRRALENVNPNIQTIGFAGFFGLATAHKGFASDVEELRLPVLLNPGVHSCSGGNHSHSHDHGTKDDESLATRYALRAKRAWGRFKLAAVSSFAFVEATGPIYVGKLIKDGLAIPNKAKSAEPAPQLDGSIDLETRIGAASTILRAMSLTDNFAQLILIAGHGSDVVNNPHASALQCGACGGYSGEVNARLLARLLNDKDVRAGVAKGGITIPDDTLFLAGLHDTASDKVTLYEDDVQAQGHKKQLDALRDWLSQAMLATNRERALKLPRAGDKTALSSRSHDWSEVRPEWALAGCQAFIAAPRQATIGKSLDGRSFLNDYDWTQDKGFPVLELIMTAPVVVASWISLQYYGSVVAPSAFGGGNKLLHNVVGGIGVLEGNGGLLRAGLPWQSVHDGEKLMHEPLRLTVCIAAPTQAMSDIIAQHQHVRDLFDNGWLHLIALDDDGKMAERYVGDLKWEVFNA